MRIKNRRKHKKSVGTIFLDIKSKEYEGGRFISDPSLKIEPIVGRASAFISGVEKVESGIRLAMGFTCNPEYAINDPKLP